MSVANDTPRWGTPAPVLLRATDRLAETPPGGAVFRVRDTGLGAATDGRFGAQVFLANGARTILPAPHLHDAELQLVYVIRGEIGFDFGDGDPVVLSAGDAVYQPAGCVHCVTAVSTDLELLEITGPATISTTKVVS